MRKPVEKAGAAAAARMLGTKPAIDGKTKAGPKMRPRRKRTAKSVASLPGKLTRLAAEATVPAQGASPASMAVESAGEPAPAPPAPAGWPEGADEPGG
jgi:hypothetical protein